VNSIHSACAAAFARHRGKTGTLHLLQEEIFRLEKAIESVRGFHSKCQKRDVDKRDAKKLMYERKELFGYRRKFLQLFISSSKKILENFTRIITGF